jgi:hypothetical protein
MGFDLQRFQSEVDEELICPICSSVMEEPLQVNFGSGMKLALNAWDMAQLAK